MRARISPSAPQPVPQAWICTPVSPRRSRSRPFLYARSGLGVKHGICLANGVGVIDSDYRGEICVGLCNVSDAPYVIAPEERVAQMVIAPVLLPEIVETDALSGTDRGAGGFGSTGKS